MKKSLIILGVLLLLPWKFSIAEEGPATYFLAISGNTETGENFDLTDLTGTFRAGIKTDLADNGLYRLIMTYRQVNVGPLADDIKALGVGAEKIYPLYMTNGFFKNSSLAVRASAQFELNQEVNDVNGVFGFGWIKKLSVDANGDAVFSIEPYIDFTAKDDRDFLTIGLSVNLTPPVLR